MDLLYSSTRNSEKKITASQAILKGLADDGGLFVKGGGKNELKQMLKCGAYNFRISNGPFPTVPLCLRMNSEKNHMFFVCGPACTYLRHPP